MHILEMVLVASITSVTLIGTELRRDKWPLLPQMPPVRREEVLILRHLVQGAFFSELF